MSSVRFRTYGRPRRNHAATSQVSKPPRVQPSYWSDEDSPKVLRKTPDPFDLLLQDEIQKSDEVFHQLSSSRLSPDPVNNLSDTSCSPMTPFINKIKSKPSKKLSKCEYKNSKENSDDSNDEGATGKNGLRANKRIVTTSKRYSKRKHKYKKRPPIFKNNEKENQSDLDNYELIVKAVEKKDNSFDTKILQSVKKSLIYQRNKQDGEKLLSTALQEIVDDNVLPEILHINRINLNSTSSLTVLENSIKEHIMKNHVPISSTPRKTIFGGHECENDVSMIPFSLTSKLDISDKDSIEKATEPDFGLDNSIASHCRHSPDIFNDPSNCKADESFDMLRLESADSGMKNPEIEPKIKLRDSTDGNSVNSKKFEYQVSEDSVEENIVKNGISEDNSLDCYIVERINSSDNSSYLDQNLSGCSKIKANNASDISDVIIEKKHSDSKLNCHANSIEDLDMSDNEYTSEDFLQKLVHCDTITMRKTSITYISDDEMSQSIDEDDLKIENLEDSHIMDENSTINNVETSHFTDVDVTIENYKKSYSIDENATIQNFEQSQLSHVDVTIENYEKSYSIEENSTIQNLEESQLSHVDVTLENYEKSYSINKTAMFENLNKSNSIDENVTIVNSEKSLSVADQSTIMKDNERSFMLLPGKKWERSLRIIKNLNLANATIDQLDSTLKLDGVSKGRKYKEGIEKVYRLQNRSVLNNTTFSSDATFVREGRKVVIKRPLDSICEKTRNSTELLLDPGNGTGALSRSRLSISRFDDDPSLTGCVEDANDDAKSVVLRKCKQYEPIPFDECYPDWKLQKCHKIGEGVYGEVYLIKKEDDPNNPIVMKVIPVEGDQLVNGERQKRFKEILSEITIATELSDLRYNETSKTGSFNKVHDVRLVQGAYPKRLKESWEEFDELKGSENDYPSYFDDQLYIVLELENGGKDIEAFEFWNAKQSYALFFQVAYALAVAEETLQFEHRDLHWGNILVKPSDDEIVKFTISGLPYSVPSCGIFANIIDYTLSRISIPKVDWVIYNDLSDEDLFCSYGDYQFEIYRLMKDEVGNSWELFKPYTNVLWLHYMLLKMINGLRYQKKTTKVHKLYLGKIQKLADRILDYESCLDFVQFEKCEI